MRSFASIPIITVLFALLVLLCISCTTEKKAVNYFNTHEIIGANYCANKYPAKDSVVTKIDTIYRKANNPDYTKIIDSLNSELGAISDGATADSIIASTDMQSCQNVVAKQARTIKGLRRLLSDIKDNYQPCKPDTVVKNINHYVENTARVKTLELALSDMTGSRDKYVSRFKFWLKAALAGWGLLILLIALIIYRASLPFKLF